MLMKADELLIGAAGQDHDDDGHFNKLNAQTKALMIGQCRHDMGFAYVHTQYIGIFINHPHTARSAYVIASSE